MNTSRRGDSCGRCSLQCAGPLLVEPPHSRSPMRAISLELLILWKSGCSDRLLFRRALRDLPPSQPVSTTGVSRPDPKPTFRAEARSAGVPAPAVQPFGPYTYVTMTTFLMQGDGRACAKETAQYPQPAHPAGKIVPVNPVCRMDPIPTHIARDCTTRPDQRLGRGSGAWPPARSARQTPYTKPSANSRPRSDLLLEQTPGQWQKGVAGIDGPVASRARGPQGRAGCTSRLSIFAGASGPFRMTLLVQIEDHTNADQPDYE